MGVSTHVVRRAASDRGGDGRLPRDHRGQHDSAASGALRRRRAPNVVSSRQHLWRARVGGSANHRQGSRGASLDHRHTRQHGALAISGGAAVGVIGSMGLGRGGALRRLPRKARALPGARPDPQCALRQQCVRAYRDRQFWHAGATTALARPSFQARRYARLDRRACARCQPRTPPIVSPANATTVRCVAEHGWRAYPSDALNGRPPRRSCRRCPRSRSSEM